MENILEYVATLSPSIASIFSVILLVIWAIKQLNNMLSLFKQGSQDITNSNQEMNIRIKELIEQNKELQAINKTLVDKLYQIDNYYEIKKGERRQK